MPEQIPLSHLPIRQRRYRVQVEERQSSRLLHAFFTPSLRLLHAPTTDDAAASISTLQ
jgi:hypothetical protein